MVDPNVGPVVWKGHACVCGRWMDYPPEMAKYAWRCDLCGGDQGAYRDDSGAYTVHCIKCHKW